MHKVLVCLCVSAAACGSDPAPHHELFPPKPECMGDPVVPYMGKHTQVINKLEIGSVEDGFDLDGDGKPDNKLAAVGSLAADAITSSMKNYEIIIPIEFFNMPTVAASSCVKFAIYLGAFDKDTDGDGKRPGISGGDCNEKDANIHPGATEVAGNGKDDDCDGLADEDAQNMPNTTDTMDRDGDGQTVKDGDCDDTNPMVKKGMAEICGDGLDNDCDGVADRSVDAMGNVTACSPFDAMRDIVLDKLSFDDSGAPVIAFKDGTIDASNKLVAGPSIFSVKIPVMAGIFLDLRISGATIEATLGADGTTMSGRLGGVIDAKTADTIRGLKVDQIGLTPENSLLDATFANLLGPLLALPKSTPEIQQKYPGCRTPDIDVDQDGLESYCDSNPDDDIKIVDICIDGDGTEFQDMGATQCTEAMTGEHLRFVDGISVELNFETTAIKTLKQPR